MLSKRTIYDLAEEVGETFHYTPGADMEPLVQRLGGVMRTRTGYASDESGSIRVDGQNQFTIYLSPYIGERRTRFTIAHELGHYIMHSEFGKKPIRIKREGSNRVEWEANWFASGFLMPTKVFRKKVEMGWSNGQLADFFNVSEAAVEIRKESIEG